MVLKFNEPDTINTTEKPAAAMTLLKPAWWARNSGVCSLIPLLNAPEANTAASTTQKRRLRRTLANSSPGAVMALGASCLPGSSSSEV